MILFAFPIRRMSIELDLRLACFIGGHYLRRSRIKIQPIYPSAVHDGLMKSSVKIDESVI